MSLNGKRIAIVTAVVAAVIAVVLVVFNPSDPYYEGGFLSLGSGIETEELPPPMDREPLINALATLSDDFGVRVASTPLPALMEVAENGTIRINFAHRDRAALFGGTTSGNIIILTDGANSNFAINGNIGLMVFMNLGFYSFINQESAAIRTSLTGGEFYGITFSTFAQDIQQFGTAINMERQTMNEMIDTVAGLEMALNAGLPDLDTPLIADARALVYSMLEFEYGYNASRDEMIVRIYLDSDDIPAFLDVLDTNFAEHLSLILPEHGSLSGVVATLVGSPEEAQVTFVIRNDRLVSINLNIHMDNDGSEYVFSTGLRACEFSAYGEWRFRSLLNAYENEERSNVWWNDIYWNIYDSPTAMEHTIATTVHEQENILTYSMQIRTIWPHENGHFGLFISDNSNERAYEGTLNVLEHGGFHLILDDMELTSTTTLSLELEAVPGGVVIESFPFINLDQWSPALMDTIGFFMDIFS